MNIVSLIISLISIVISIYIIVKLYYKNIIYKTLINEINDDLRVQKERMTTQFATIHELRKNITLIDNSFTEINNKVKNHSKVLNYLSKENRELKKQKRHK